MVNGHDVNIVDQFGHSNAYCLSLVVEGHKNFPFVRRPGRSEQGYCCRNESRMKTVKAGRNVGQQI